MHSRYVITANHTGAGKTLVSSILALGLKASYWKPVQAGTAEETDTEFVTRVTSGKVFTHPERYRLAEPRSPHAAAGKEGILIDPSQLIPPPDTLPLIIEGPGGLMVPLTPTFLFADLLEEWKLPVVLVVHTYLGCINHTLLTAEALDKRGIPVQGVVINDGGYPESEDIILQRTGYCKIGHVPSLNAVNAETLQEVFERNFQSRWTN